MNQPFTHEHKTARVSAPAAQTEAWHYAKTSHPAHAPLVNQLR